MPSFKRLLLWLAIAILGLGMLGAAALATAYFVVSARLPEVDTLRDIEMQEPLYVYARDGRLIALFGETRRYPIRIEEVPEQVKQAFIAIEDARFYEHRGVDYRGVARAIWLLATTDDERVPGGSTITQQVARQIFLSSEYSYTRKFAEMLLAMKMERELTKDEILELYLNKSFFGHRAYGVAAAAEFYYGKELDELTLDEAATLASIPKFPSSGNPVTNPERARIRRDYTMQRMHELGHIDAAAERAGKAAPMHARPHEPPVEVYAPYVAEMVRQEMIARYGGDVLTKGYHVTTTIDPAFQAAAEHSLHEGLTTYDHRYGWSGAEQAFELADDEDAATAAARLRGIPAQAGMRPAIVLRSGGDTAEVVLVDGTTVTLDAESSAWTRRSPGALVERGDMVRVRRIETPAPQADEGEGAGPAEPTVAWRLAQIPRAQATVVSMEYDTGALRALVGGFSFAGQKFNRATQARRQPGSAFKPFIFAASFERGFNPASIVPDAPVVFRMRRGQDWRPNNADGRFMGPMQLRNALALSRNLVSVRLLDAIGVDYARRYISHFGFDESELPPNLSISLGTPSLTPLAVTRGYAVFANGGFRVTPWFIDEVHDRSGEVVFQANPARACRGCAGGHRPDQPVATAQPQTPSHIVDGFDFGPAAAAPAAPAPDVETEPADAPAGDEIVLRGGDDDEEFIVAPRAIDERVAWQLVSMMRDVVRRGTGSPARVLEREDIGGKTGSTNDFRDAWFVGFGGDLVTTVWVGRDDNRSLGRREYGGRSALPIWIDYMGVALDGQEPMPHEVPDGLVQVNVSEGGRLLPAGSGGRTEYVKAEDVERMAAQIDDGFDDAMPAEEVYDIF